MPPKPQSRLKHFISSSLLGKTNSRTSEMMQHARQRTSSHRPSLPGSGAKSYIVGLSSQPQLQRTPRSSSCIAVQFNHNPDCQALYWLHICNTKCGCVQARPEVVQNALICHIARYSLTKHLRVIGNAGPHLRQTPGVAAQRKTERCVAVGRANISAGPCACWSGVTYKCTLLVFQVKEAVHAPLVSTTLRRPPPCSCKALPEVVICWKIPHVSCPFLRSAHSRMWFSSTTLRTFLAPTPEFGAVPIHCHDLLTGKCTHATEEGLGRILPNLGLVPPEHVKLQCPAADLIV